MSPELENGDFAVAKCLPKDAKLYIGDIVQVDHPDLGMIVKYVATLSPGGVRLFGAASSSIDSHATGLIPRDRVHSRLVLRINPLRVHRLDLKYRYREAES